MNKKHLLVLFGGQSSEHEVSCRSAVTIIGAVDQDKYDMLLVGITKEGHWVKVDGMEQIKDGSWRNSQVSAILSPDASQGGIWLMEANGPVFWKVDVAFPVLHGLWGEDGTIQGVFELAKIPYVGCGVLASAVSMDKVYTKLIVDDLGIRQAKYQVVHREQVRQAEKLEAAMDQVEAVLPYPVFIKPSCAGSSCGVSKAENREQLMSGLKLAAEHDRKILVEEAIVGREVECAVLGGSDVRASGVGEILAAAQFYDYDAKYNNAESKTVVNAEMSEESREEIRRNAVAIFKAVDGWGLSRVDFFLQADGQVVFNEINTMPGFTSISMYPMLWEARGLALQPLVDRLIQNAFARE